jgi:hypothetical protein
MPTPQTPRSRSPWRAWSAPAGKTWPRISPRSRSRRLAVYAGWNREVVGVARVRYLKPEFFDSTTVASVSFPARLLFAGLWTLADREGRLALEPRRIKARIFPYDDVVIETLFDELLDKHLAVAYEAEGRLCLWLPGFLEHQRPHPNEAKSTLPQCPLTPAILVLPWQQPKPQLNVTSPNDGWVQPSGELEQIRNRTDQGENRARTRGLSIIQPRDLNAFWEGPVFNLPRKWADAAIRKANNHLTEAQLVEFANALTAKAQRDKTDIQALPNFLGWLDDELRAWRGRAADQREDHRGDHHLEMVERMKRGEYDR